VSKLDRVMRLVTRQATNGHLLGKIDLIAVSRG
jgi:hypothetical protein